MMVWIFTVFVYVFFIYGVIEFIKNVFIDISNRRNTSIDHKIEVMVNNAEELEYILNSLKKNFNHIVLILEQQDTDILRIINSIRDNIQIEYRVLQSLGEAEKSYEDF
ncbi:hypothetical protein [Brassicibacter mesophilus]|uniref:hypothetical protein n=1 Tax=Brassicibacter mesophilus TaxID=745119 RepID=UPI003D1FE424